MKQHIHSPGTRTLVCLGLVSHCDDTLASTGPILDFFYGYLSIYLVIPILILIPLIREWIRRDKFNKTDRVVPLRIMLIASIGCLVLDAALGWLIFGFNFKGPIGMSGEEGWWILYFLAAPPHFLTIHYSDSKNRSSS